MWLVQSRSECFFGEGNNVFTIEDILEMRNVDNTITEAARYNVSIWCHYIAWALKICLENLNEVNNGFTWDGVQPKISPFISFSGMYRKLFILRRNRNTF